MYAVRSEFTTEIRCCYCGCHCCVPNADRDDRARSKKKEIMDKRTKRHVRIAARGNERLSQEIVGNPKGVKKKDRHAPYSIYYTVPVLLLTYSIATLGTIVSSSHLTPIKNWSQAREKRLSRWTAKERASRETPNPTCFREF